MPSVNSEFWAGKRIFLTGHTGFKGAWLSQILCDFGAQVSGFSLEPNTQPSMFNVLRLADRLQHKIGDICEREAFETAILEASPDIIFHMAAQPIVSEGYIDPMRTLETNLIGTANLLETLRNSGAQIPVLVISSDKCYLNEGDGTAFLEQHPLGGRDPYSASKAATEIIVNSYRDSFFSKGRGIRLASVRAGNVVGGGDWCVNRLVPDLARAFASNRTALIRSPEAIRPWQHVLEPLVGYLMCAEAISVDESFAQPWNFGPPPEDVHSVSKVVECMQAHWPGPTNVSQSDKIQTWAEQNILSIDPMKAHAQLGWKTIFCIDECIGWTADWYHSYYSKPSSAVDLTQKQIQAYLSLSSKELG